MHAESEPSIKKISHPGKEDDPFKIHALLAKNAQIKKQADTALAHYFATQAMTNAKREHHKSALYLLQAQALHRNPNYEVMLGNLLSTNLSSLQYYVRHSQGFPCLISPSKKIMATVSSFISQDICIRRTADGSLITRIVKSDSMMTAQSFDDSESRYCYATSDGAIMIHNALTGERMTTLKNEHPHATWLTFSKETNELISFHKNGMICKWDIDKATHIKSIDTGVRESGKITTSHDGKTLAFCDENKTQKVQIWDLVNLQPVVVSYEHPAAIATLCFHPSQPEIAILSQNHLAMVSTVTGKLVSTIYEDDEFSAGSYDPKFSYLTTGVDGNYIGAFERGENGEPIYFFQHNQSVNFVSHDREHKWIATGQTMTANLYSRATGTACGTSYSHKYLSQIHFHPALPLFLTVECTGAGGIMAWKLPEIESEKSLTKIDPSWRIVNPTSHPEFAMAADQKGNAQAVDRTTGSLTGKIFPHGSRVWHTDSSNASRILTIDVKDSVHVWERKSGERLHGPHIAKDVSNALLHSDPSKILIFTPHAVGLMDGDSGVISAITKEHEDDSKMSLDAYDYHPQTNQLIYALDNSKDMNLQQAEVSAPIQTIKKPGKNIRKIRFSSCGKFLTVIHYDSWSDRSITLINIATKQSWTTKKDWSDLDAHDACLTSDCKYVIGTYEGICRWWQVSQDGTLLLVSAFWNDSDTPATVQPDTKDKNQKVICLLRYPGARFQRVVLEPFVLPSHSTPFDSSTVLQQLAEWERKTRSSLRNKKGIFDSEGNPTLDNL